jgi:peptidoglycan/LPS O-acetylase OafA/YrhL
MSTAHSFRLDIQGLRAIAVLAVVIFHLLPRKLSGGFVGVDVFFVISGFLITGIVLRDIGQNRFSLANFYARRIRRLFPALITMLLACAMAVLVVGLPQDIQLFGQSALASVFYASNFFFLTQSGYFDNSQTLNLLLHTWSLSVEEQFYLVLPGLLILFHRFFPNRSYLPLLVIGLVSLIACIVVSRLYPTTAFFSSPTRFWQFVAGGLLVLVPAAFLQERRKLLQLGGWIGLLLLLYAFREISEDDAYPGYHALIPTVATVLLILGGTAQDGWLNKLLSLRWMQFFGSISYSLYLWHWPVIVCYKLWFSAQIDEAEALNLFAISTFLAYGSWRFIENPLRHSDPAKPLFRATYLPALLSTLLVSGIAITFVATGGMKQLFPPLAVAMNEYIVPGKKHNEILGPCFLEKAPKTGPAFNRAECIQGQPGGNNRVLLAGDSHAAHFVLALKTAWPEVQFSQVTGPGCRVLLPPKKSADCSALMNLLYEEIAPGERFSTIILAGRWDSSEMAKMTNAINFLRQYSDRIILLGPVVEYSIALPRAIAIAGDSPDASQKIASFNSLQKTSRTDEKLAESAKELGVEYYSVVNALCTEEDCTTITANGVPVQFDYGHLTYEGALLVMERLRDQQGLQLR